MVEIKKEKKSKQSHQLHEKHKKQPLLEKTSQSSVPKYEDIVKHKIRPSYPSPIIEKGKDKNFEELVKHSLDEILKLKHKEKAHSSFLGTPERILNCEEDIVEQRSKVEIPQSCKTPQEVISKVSSYFNGVLDNASPIMLENVHPPSNIPAIISTLFASLYNVGMVQDEFSWNVVLTEIETIGMMAKLIGWDAKKANGVFTFGGTGNELYGIKVALTRALGMDYRYKGIRENVKIFVSEIGHYCKFNVTDWLGIGMDNVVPISITEDNSMNYDDLYDKLSKSVKNGEKIAAIVSTCGSTDPFSVDDVSEIVKIRDRIVEENNLDYKPFVYADSVIGWPWLFFKTYNFEENPLQIEADYVLPAIKSVLSKMEKLELADAVGLDFHKTGFCHYICSCVMFKDGKEFEENLSRPKDFAQYLYNFSVYKPGTYTLECSRAASCLAAFSTIHLFGVEGYQSLIAHLISVQHALRTNLTEQMKNVAIVNDLDNGFVSLFRVYPQGVDAKKEFEKELNGQLSDDEINKYNEYQKHIANVLHLKRVQEDGPALSYTRCFRKNKNGCPISALKVFPMSPFCSKDMMINHVVPFIKDTVEQVGSQEDMEEHKKKVESEDHPKWAYPRHRHFENVTLHNTW
ncbi:predicted protein [Naegleria gruberi]|uniref:Predicted protein n=1 Tax=Naegleria gruberi TaxID=5762 RepID=D2VVC8_NAEGR|nr:uncharacterized protein NAEGRDRAFT_72970 [Naegleria gruberi]EFC39212.1 predicted protein [Naegleria gruberi]|eukprot:XP_002671956.1 predicted protein [Naegleria gruberi strain NEG-M]